MARSHDLAQRGMFRGQMSPELNQQRSQLGYNPQLASRHEYDPGLASQRHQTQQDLKRKFEHIFAKYERDFEGIGDEIDLETGDIVLNNGHLSNMRHESDTGARSLQGTYLSSPAIEDPQSEGHTVGQLADDSGIEPVDGACRVMPDCDESTPQPDEVNEICQRFGINRAGNNHRQRPTPNTSRTSASVPGNTPQQITDHSWNDMDTMSSLRDSVLALQTQGSPRRSMDPSVVQTLGIEIANRLCGLLSGSSPGKVGRKPQTSASRDPWAYPSLPNDSPRVKHRSQTQQTEFRRLPPRSSPTRESLWAPIRPVGRQRKLQIYHIESRNTRNNNGDADELKDGNHSSSAQGMHAPLSHSRCVACGSLEYAVGRVTGADHLCTSCSVQESAFATIDPSASSVDGSDKLKYSTLDDKLNIQHDKRLEDRSITSHKRFCAEDDALLIKSKEIDSLTWQQIALRFPNRTAFGLQCRYSKVLHNTPSKGRDMLITQGFNFQRDGNGKYSAGNIGTFQKYVEEVNSKKKRCRTYSKEEDELLHKLRGQEKLQWIDMASQFPGRNPAGLQKRYTCGLTKRQHYTDPSNGPFSQQLRREKEQLLLHLRDNEKLPWKVIVKRMSYVGSLSSLQYKYRTLKTKQWHEETSGAVDVPSPQDESWIDIDQGEEMTIETAIEENDDETSWDDSEKSNKPRKPSGEYRNKTNIGENVFMAELDTVAQRTTRSKGRLSGVNLEELHSYEDLSKARSRNSRSRGNKDSKDTSVSGKSSLTDGPHKEPTYTWTELITMALQSQAPAPMTTNAIVEYVAEAYPLYKRNGAMWTNNVHKQLRSQLEFECVGLRPAMWRLVESSDSKAPIGTKRHRTAEDSQNSDRPVKRPRGRPPGSRSKKNLTATTTTSDKQATKISTNGITQNCSELEAIVDNGQPCIRRVTRNKVAADDQNKQAGKCSEHSADTTMAEAVPTPDQSPVPSSTHVVFAPVTKVTQSEIGMPSTLGGSQKWSRRPTILQDTESSVSQRRDSHVAAVMPTESTDQPMEYNSEKRKHIAGKSRTKGNLVGGKRAFRVGRTGGLRASSLQRVGTSNRRAPTPLRRVIVNDDDDSEDEILK